MRTSWGRDEHTTMALACPATWWAILVRKCSMVISAFWARLSGMQGDEPGDGGSGLGCVVGGVVEDGLLQVQVLLVGDVVGQHVL